MPDIELKRLRTLRRQARTLLATLTSDLRPFRHDKETSGFRRKSDSDSPPDDVNVTTTCSCLMSLALSERLIDFYGADGQEKAKEIFDTLFLAPWMSSGLSENNAFTTTLVIRLFGFLAESKVVGPAESVKLWEPAIAFAESKFGSVAARLVTKEHPFAKFLFESLPLPLQGALRKMVEAGSESAKLEKKVVAEFERLVRTSHFYLSGYVADLASNVEIKKLLKKELDGYMIPQLNRLLLHEFFVDEFVPLKKLSIKEIAFAMSKDINHFKINDYEPAAAVLYWFVDGITRAEIDLPPEHWDRLCRSAVDEFGRQRSRFVARQAATMDPVAMAMSACLCARLRTISSDLRLGTNNNHHSMLPSTVELESAIVDLFAEQTSSGIWPKYFPLFHYQDAGSNFCFTFELLEALLVEFGGEHNRLITADAVISGLERAVLSCEQNRLQCAENESGKALPYNGWNSGGNLETLRRGQPESWATAVVHMFLWELVEVLSHHIQQRLLDKYVAIKPPKEWNGIEGLLDIELLLSPTPASLKKTLLTEIIKTFERFRGKSAERLRKLPVQKGRLSALLFGPPGTSKTEVAKAIASELEWPLLEIDPSHFLQGSFQNIYFEAEKIFEDVMDLCGVVVLFDEMDALVQKRDGEKASDTESKFLTTYMLPKLAKLHDRGQIVFLMATNFQATFDDAIKRAGRFDLLLCMGPPTLVDKCASIHRFLGCAANVETKLVGQIILDFANKDSWVEDQLSLYTFGDFKSFVRHICTVEEIAMDVEKLRGLTRTRFRALVKKDCQTAGLKLDALGPLRGALKLKSKRLKDLDAAKFEGANLKKVDIKVPVVKYMLDRQQSKLQ